MDSRRDDIEKEVFGERVPDQFYIRRPAAYVVISDPDGRIAAVRGRKGHFFLPGGGSLAGESPEETIARELREELARDVTITGWIAEAIQYFSTDGKHYRLEAVFYRAEFAGEQDGEAEHELYWLASRDVDDLFYHECQKWAVGLGRRENQEEE